MKPMKHSPALDIRLLLFTLYSLPLDPPLQMLPARRERDQPAKRVPAASTTAAAARIAMATVSVLVKVPVQTVPAAAAVVEAAAAAVEAAALAVLRGTAARSARSAAV